MKILITGGAGFIGSHLAESLLKNNHEVAVVDNYETGKVRNINAIRNQIYLANESIVDYPAMERVFREFRPNVVVHAAASYKDPTDWSEDAATNVVGTANVVKLAEELAVDRVIYFQTSLCYGLHPDISPITIDYPCNPQGTSYAITKTAGEQLLFLSKKLDVVSFRLANHSGEKNASGPVPIFYNRLSQGKSCFVMDTRRDFVYVGDLIKLVNRAIAGEGHRGAYHVSTGKDYHIKDLYDSVRQALGLPADPEVKIVPRGEDDAPTLLIDPLKTHTDFPGWAATTPLADWVVRTVDWYKANPVEQTYTHLKIKE